MVATVRRAWRRAKGLSQDGLIWARNTAVKVVLLALLITFQLWLAFFMYGTFYYASMPTQLHTKQVYLDFSICEHFDGSPSCPFPSSNISLVEDASSDKLFMPGQRYTIRLEMEMPQSPVNENLGNFMVKLQMYSKGDEITSQSSRPALLRYRSPFLKAVDVFFLAPFFVTGYSEEKQILNVELMHDFVDNAYKPAVKMGLHLRARHIEIYSSVIRIHAQFTGLRYLMFYWPLSTAAVSVFVNFCFLTILSMLLWRQCVSTFLGDQALEEQEAGTSLAPALTYEERRRIARQSMETERSNLFRSRPPHVTIVDPLDAPTPRGQLQSSSAPAPTSSSSQRPSSPTKGPQRGVRRRAMKGGGTQGTVGGNEHELQSSGISSDNSDTAKGGKAEVETLEGESSRTGSSGGSVSTTSEDTPPGFEKVKREEIVEDGEDDDDDDIDEEEEKKKEDDEEDVASAGRSDAEQLRIPQGILRHRSVPSAAELGSHS